MMVLSVLVLSSIVNLFILKKKHFSNFQLNIDITCETLKNIINIKYINYHKNISFSNYSVSYFHHRTKRSNMSSTSLLKI